MTSIRFTATSARKKSRRYATPAGARCWKRKILGCARFTISNRPCSLEVPAINRWAIFGCPCGAEISPVGTTELSPAIHRWEHEALNLFHRLNKQAFLLAVIEFHDAVAEATPSFLISTMLHLA